MKLEITLKDRLLTEIFFSVLNVTALNILDAVVLKSILDALKITSKDIEKYNIRETDGTTTWDGTIPHKFKHEFTDRQIEIIKKVSENSTLSNLSISQIPEYITQIITHGN